MKKLLISFALLIISFIGYGQNCNPPATLTTTWHSSTHDYYATNSPYKFNPVYPTTTDELFLWMFAAGKNNYRITAPSGDVPFSYTWRIGTGSAGNGTSGNVSITLVKTSNEKASSITTNHGTLSVSDIGSWQPNHPQFQNPLTNINLGYNDPAPGIERTITFPANPYMDRSLSFSVYATHLYYHTPICSFPITTVQYFGDQNNMPPIAQPHKIDQMYTPWLEITLPPRSPLTTPGLRAWWKWKTDVTAVSNAVSQWNDQSGNGYHMTQATATKRPAYDATTGKITGDGVNDFLQAATSINDNQGEVMAVIELPASGYNGARALIGKDMHSPAVDGDALNFWIDGNGKIQKSIFVGNGQPMTSNESVTTGQKVIISWSSSKMFINGVECTYAQNYGGTWSGQAQNSMMRMFRGACAAVGCSYYSNASIYDAMVFDHMLTSDERTALVQYYKQQHNIN